MKKIFSLFAAVLFAGSMMADAFVLVSDASTLAAGDEIIITNADGNMALSITQNTGNRSAVAVTDDEGVIVPGENVQIITLEASGDNFMLNVGADKYLYAASSSQNQLKTSSAATAGDNGKFAITVGEENVAAVEAQGTNRPSMRYNPNNGNPVFSCYASTSSVAAGLRIYKKDASVEHFDYYLVGSMTEWAPNAAYRMVVNTEAEGEEYMLDIELEGAAEMKVAYSNGSVIEDANWFPTGMGNNFAINDAGSYTIYFRPSGDMEGEEGWHYGMIYAVYHEPLVVVDCATAREAGLSVSANNEVYTEGDKEVFTVRGYVTSEPSYNDQYHNVTFWMADAADGGNVIQAYRAACATADDAPALGDAVEIVGKISKYGANPQFMAGSTFTILDDIHTAIDNTNAAVKAVKTIENGRLVIIKNGVRFDATGARL